MRTVNSKVKTEKEAIIQERARPKRKVSSEEGQVERDSHRGGRVKCGAISKLGKRTSGGRGNAGGREKEKATTLGKAESKGRKEGRRKLSGWNSDSMKMKWKLKEGGGGRNKKKKGSLKLESRAAQGVKKKRGCKCVRVGRRILGTAKSASSNSGLC